MTLYVYWICIKHQSHKPHHDVQSALSFTLSMPRYERSIRIYKSIMMRGAEIRVILTTYSNAVEPQADQILLCFLGHDWIDNVWYCRQRKGHNDAAHRLIESSKAPWSDRIIYVVLPVPHGRLHAYQAIRKWMKFKSHVLTAHDSTRAELKCENGTRKILLPIK